MAGQLSELFYRRRWFEEYLRQPPTDKTPLNGRYPAHVRYTCPCCGYPTLEGRGNFEVCELCNWEDDGQDDPHADKTGGPNQKYSLTLARNNFLQYGVMYSPEYGDPRPRGSDTPTVSQIKQAISVAFNHMVDEIDATVLGTLWTLVGDQEQLLREEFQKRQKFEEAEAVDSASEELRQIRIWVDPAALILFLKKHTEGDRCDHTFEGTHTFLADNTSEYAGNALLELASAHHYRCDCELLIYLSGLIYWTYDHPLLITERQPMNRAELQSFLAHPRNAIIAVNRPGNAPHLTPVWFTWDGEVFRFSTTRDRAKYANIRRDPQISLIVDDAATHTYVVATGVATILEDNPLALSRPLLEKHLPADRLEQSLGMVTDPDRVLIELRPTKILVNGAPLET